MVIGGGGTEGVFVCFARAAEDSSAGSLFCGVASYLEKIFFSGDFALGGDALGDFFLGGEGDLPPPDRKDMSAAGQCLGGEPVADCLFGETLDSGDAVMIVVVVRGWECRPSTGWRVC